MKVIKYRVWNTREGESQEDVLHLELTLKTKLGDEFHLHTSSEESSDLLKKYLGLVVDQCLLPQLDILGYRKAKDEAGLDQIIPIETYRQGISEKSPAEVVEEIEQALGPGEKYQGITSGIKLGKVKVDVPGFSETDFDNDAQGAEAVPKKKAVDLTTLNEPKKQGIMTENEINGEDGDDDENENFDARE